MFKRTRPMKFMRSSSAVLLTFLSLLISVNATPLATVEASTVSQTKAQLADEEKIKNVINAYFKLRYEGQKLLKAQDFSYLLADKNRNWVQAEKDKREIELYVASAYNLNYMSYQYTLDYESIQISLGQATVHLREGHEVVFAALAPEVSRMANLEHIITLTQTKNDWKILDDEYQDELTRLMAEKNKDVIIEQVRLNYAADAQQVRSSVFHSHNLARLAYQRALTSHSYNRIAAIQYADYWATKRNVTTYHNETNNDCTNYVSQALYEGTSHTMSTPDNYMTKWYYDFPSHSGSYPWVNVDGLRSFLLNNYSNGGRGPKGINLQSMCSLQPGDVVQLRNGSIWFHTVIIVVKLNSSCSEASFLYDAHDVDRFHYPLSYLSSYTKRYTAVVGWND